MSGGVTGPHGGDADLRALVLGRRSQLLIAAGAGLGVCLLAALIPQTRGIVGRAYLTGWSFWFGLSLGGLCLTMLHHLTGGRWGLAIRRPLESAGMTLLPMAVLLLPIVIAAFDKSGTLYRWTNPEWVEHHEVVKAKVGYLNPGFFAVRYVLYFALWVPIAWLLYRWSSEQDTVTPYERPGYADPSRRLAVLSGPGLALVFLSATFAVVDWMMSLEPDWYSSMYPVMVLVGWGLTTWAGGAIVTGLLRHKAPLDRINKPILFNDLGNLMLAFTMLWAYTSFMQFLIIWAGNLAEDIPWYLRRIRGGWELIAVLLIGFHFFAPFFLLLIRGLKRQPETLRKLAIGILVLHFLDLCWLILPSAVEDPLGPYVRLDVVGILLSVAAAVGVGAVWLTVFGNYLAARPLAPMGDPSVEFLADDLIHEHGHGHGHGSDHGHGHAASHAHGA